MAVYRFRVTFEDYDEVIREIDMLSSHTFLDFHRAIHQATGYDPSLSSSFYVSNDHWKKGQEVAYLPTEKKIEQGVTLMEGAKLNRFIDDPHQKFYYRYNFAHPFDFHVQLIRILKEEPGKEYPLTTKSIGQAPKPPGAVAVPSAEGTDDTTDDKASKKSEEPKNQDDYDFLNETEYGIDESEDLDLLNEDEQDGESDAESGEGFEEEF